MKKLLTTLLLATVAWQAVATTIGLHLASTHDKEGFNDTNPGLYVRADKGLTAGTVFNSERRQSFYLGKTWDYQVSGRFTASITAGGITGYRLAITPMVIPSAALRLTSSVSLRLATLARVNRDGANALHLSVETSI